MNLKQTILFIAASLIGIIGVFLDQTNKEGGDSLKGVGIGIMITLAFQIVPQLIKRKKETS
jgi:hypothetical protein